MGSESREKPSPPIGVYLVVQNRLLREALVRVLQKRAGMSVVGESHYSEETMEHFAATECDVLLLDSITTVYAHNLTDDVNERISKTKVVLFGMDEDPDCFLKAVRLGVCGYLLKDASATQIISAIQNVSQAQAVCPPRLCMSLFQLVSQDYRRRTGLDDQQACIRIGLTYRQRQLMALVSKGMTNKEIAANLNLSEFTIKNHIHRIMKHVEASTRQEAVDVIRAGGFLPSA